MPAGGLDQQRLDAVERHDVDEAAGATGDPHQRRTVDRGDHRRSALAGSHTDEDRRVAHRWVRRVASGIRRDPVVTSANAQAPCHARSATPGRSAGAHDAQRANLMDLRDVSPGVDVTPPDASCRPLWHKNGGSVAICGDIAAFEGRQ